MDTKRICPGCQKPMPPDVLTALCPECLLKAGFNTGTDPGTDKTTFVPPTIEEIRGLFPELEILSFVGKGGMGAVYKARQPALDRFVALKILPPDVAKTPGFAERFNREARTLAKLVHPNIVAIHDFGKAGNLHYLIMEFVDGANLREVERAGRLTPEQALAIVPQICEALQFAHNGGIVHRDIKPENILLDSKGRVKITDFGIAKIIGVSPEKGSLTGAKDVIGTPHYMAPEQIERPALVDHRADIFSLGVVFYEMLTGELPLGRFVAPSKKVHMDVRLDEVVLHALEKEPERRYQQAGQVKTEVEMIASTPPALAGVAAPSSVSSAGKSGNVTAAAIALMVGAMWKILSALSFALLFGGGVGWLGKSMEPMMDVFGGATILTVILFKVIPAGFIFYGAYRMLQRQSYGWAIAAAIISIVSCSLIGLPIGIWALIVLNSDAAKAEFGAAPAPPGGTQKPSGSWKTAAVITGSVILIPLALLLVGLITWLTVPAFGKARELSDQELRDAGIQRADGEYRKDFTQTLPLVENGRLRLDDVNGRVEVHGWNSNSVLITAVIHGKYSEGVEGVRIEVDSKPEAINVHTAMPRKNGRSWIGGYRNNATVDYTVQVPQKASLQEISSVNGEVVIDGVSGDIAASTINGETTVSNASANLKLSTVNGRVNANIASLDEVQTVSLDAVNGVLKVSLPPDANARVSVSTVNGSISSEFPSLQPKKEFPVGKNLNGTLGSGSASVKMTTVNGTVKILKAAGRN